VHAELGVFGGSGFYSFLDDATEVNLDTPWGPPAAPVTIGEVAGRRVAFLPRHGRDHDRNPAQVPYRANLWAMRELGVSRIFGPCAAGSLQPSIAPGHVVVCDQLVDRTWGRPDTFFDGAEVVHIAFADPYCPELRATAIAAVRGQGVTAHEAGTMVVIQGPRFSTRAESRAYAAQGFEVIGMTQHPEAYLARELGLCYATLAMVTDYDAGLEGHPDVAAVTMDQVVAVFEENLGRLRAVLHDALASVPHERSCSCAEAAGGKVPAPPS
jgi:5'-methylthioadenosine phosphorylase